MLLLGKKVAGEDWLIQVTCIIWLLRTIPDLFLTSQQHDNLYHFLDPEFQSYDNYDRERIFRHIEQLVRSLDPDDLRYLINDPGGNIGDAWDDGMYPHHQSLEDLGGMLGQTPWTHQNIGRGPRGGVSPSLYGGGVDELPPKVLDNIQRDQQSDITSIMNRLNSLAGGRANALINGIMRGALPNYEDNIADSATQQPRTDLSPNQFQAYLLQTGSSGGLGSTGIDETPSNDRLSVGPTSSPPVNPAPPLPQSPLTSRIRVRTEGTFASPSSLPGGISSSRGSTNVFSNLSRRMSMSSTGLVMSNPLSVPQLFASVPFIQDHLEVSTSSVFLWNLLHADH